MRPRLNPRSPHPQPLSSLVERGDFKKQVLEAVRNIPAGDTMTYKEVAEDAGRPGAARAVGTIMRRNYDPDVPCHRVVRSDGKLGGYNRGVDRKVELLHAEGVSDL